MVKRSVRIYIEGGAIGNTADTDFRRGWKKFLSSLHQIAISQNFHSLEVVRGKGRSDAFKRFRNHKKSNPNDLCVLLVDSEVAVPDNMNLWDVVANRVGDSWQRPSWASEDHLYFMVPFIEAWLITDHDALATFFMRDFDPSVLPTTDIENRTKIYIERALQKATSRTKKGAYRHGDSHFIIEKTQPNKVRTLKHGNRLFESLSALIKTS